jgi:hypothetical protein
MTDNLVKRLRSPNGPFNWEDAVATYLEAADRIEQLEIDLEVEECRKSAAMPFHSGLLERTEKLTAALREIVELGFWDGDRAMGIACKALEGKDD